MRLPRFTIRRLMKFVGTAAVILWAARLVADRQNYLELATGHEMTSRLFRGEIRCCFSLGTEEEMQVIAEYHDKLARKYERASCCPWLPVELDPPYPQRVASSASDGP
jgi:hypothetical protein